MRAQHEICISNSLIDSYINYQSADDLYFQYWQNSESATPEHYNAFITEKEVEFLQKYFKITITEYNGVPVVPRDDYKMRFGSWFEDEVIYKGNVENLEFDGKRVVISEKIKETLNDVIADCKECEYQKFITTPDFQNFKGYIDFFNEDLIIDIKTTWNFKAQTYIDNAQVPLYQKITNAGKGCYVVFEAKDKEEHIEVSACNILYTEPMQEWKYNYLKEVSKIMISNYEEYKEKLKNSKYYDIN